MVRRGAMGLASVLVVAVLALLLVIPFASAQRQEVWAGPSAFLAGTLINTDASSQPGVLVLARTLSNWTMFAGNPVLGPTQSWDSDWVAVPDVHYDSGVYKMWYQGCIGQTCDIGYATSSDGTTWSPYAGNPVLVHNPSGWDTTLGIPKVIHDGSVYRMWYAGNGPLAIRIGYATSSDGIHWTKYGNFPVFNGTMSWDAGATATPAVVKVGSAFVMYFSGHPGNYDYSMGRATSPDGINWTEYSGNPVMIPTALWEGTRVHPGAVSYGPSGYDLYYTGGSPGGLGGIGHATSPDGVTFTKDAANPVLHAGPPGSWYGTSIAHPDPVLVGTQMRMYFTGYNQSILQIGYAVPTPGGMAYASSGSWTSPVFDSLDRNTTWSSLSWTATIPANTGIGASVQIGNTSIPDFTWAISPPSLSTPVTLLLPRARYARVIVALVSLDGSDTPSLESVRLTYETSTPSSSTSEFWGLGALGFALLLLVATAGSITVAAVLFLLVSGSRVSARPRATPQAFLACPRCGSSLPPGNRFCGRCGYALSPPGPRGPPGG